MLLVLIGVSLVRGRAAVQSVTITSTAITPDFRFARKQLPPVVMFTAGELGRLGKHWPHLDLFSAPAGWFGWGDIRCCLLLCDFTVFFGGWGAWGVCVGGGGGYSFCFCTGTSNLITFTYGECR